MAWAYYCFHSHSSFRSLANGREAVELAQSLLNSWTTAADGLVDPVEGQDTHQEPPSHTLLGFSSSLPPWKGRRPTMVGLSGGQDWLGGKRRRRSGASVLELGFSDRASGGE